MTLDIYKRHAFIVSNCENSMDKNLIYQLVQEEVRNMISEATEKAPKIAQELEKLRKKFHKDEKKKENFGAQVPRNEKRVQLSTVAELIDVPVNTLMLYFLNDIKANNERQLIEYRLGQVVFYAE